MDQALAGVVVHDAAGNASVPSAGFSGINVDLKPPAPPSALGISPDTGTLPTAGVSHTGAVTFHGSLGEQGLRVHLFDVTANADLGDPTVSGTTFSKALTLAEGGHQLRATAEDAAGNLSAAGPFQVFIDLTPPSSGINPLPPVVTAPSFTVSWWRSAGPGGLGVASCDVYVSVDGGPFTPWLTGTTAPAAVYAGAYGHRYAFYSVATDALGFRQPAAGAQASTAVEVPPVHDVTTQVRVSQGKGKRKSGSRLTLTLSNASGTDLYGPISLVLGKLPRKIRLRNATGTTQAFGQAGRPYLDVIPSGGVFRAGSSLAVTLVFSGPVSSARRFMPQLVLAGPGAR
jgi:hypothetical protein